MSEAKQPRSDGNNVASESVGNHGDRLRLIYQLLKFQVKLLLDGMSDFVLSMLALGAVIVGLIRGGPDADRPLRDVMALGQRTEHWINLYGANQSTSSADAAFEPIERALEARLRRGGVIGGAASGRDTAAQSDAPPVRAAAQPSTPPGPPSNSGPS